jgi:hypothetical protein
MKATFEDFKPLMTLVLALLVPAGCGTVKQYVDVPVMAPEVKPAQTIKNAGDYLGKDVVLARFMWEDFYEAQFFPARIITAASESTEGEYEVESLAGSPDVGLRDRIWTKDVIHGSHPGKEEELKAGMVVLYTGDEDQPLNEEELKVARWSRGVIMNTDELYKDVVELRGGLYRGSYKIHLTAIRIIDKAPAHVLDVPVEE